MGDATEVHEIVSRIDYPMYVVTAAAGGERAGCLVGFTTQCSIDPPAFLVCISIRNHTYRVASAAESLVVHLLPDDAADLAELFGEQTGDDVDKFADCDWRPGPGGAPVLERCGNWFAGRVRARVEAGDHVAFLLDTFDGQSTGDERPFSFHRARRLTPGHEA